MNRKHILSSLLAASLLATSATRVDAGSSDAVAGAIVGGLIGAAIASDVQRKRYYRTTTVRKVYRKPTISSAQRAENRTVQHALNYFGFNAGGADGVIGRNSRAAISRYQAYMGYPATGQLTSYEQNFLITSYNRAMAGGYATTQYLAANGMNQTGLLIAYRDGLATTAPMPVASSTTVVVAPQVAAPAPAPMPAPVAVETPAPAATAPGLPVFMGTASAASLASHCNTVSLMTNTNGGFTTVDTLADPDTALNEQFCLARTYAIANGETLMQKVQGFTSEQIATQCRGLAPLLKEQVAALSVRPKDEVLQQVSAFVLSAGMAPAQLGQTARICLGAGYRTDDMDVAVASALLLVALGEQAYGELLGHHLSQGFGATRRTDLSLAWYGASLAAVEQGAQAAFVPGQPDRVQLIRAAVSRMGGAQTPPAMAVAGAQENAIPTFTVSQ